MMVRASPFSPLEGEMAPKRPEGVAPDGTATVPRTAAWTPPGRFAATLPSGGSDTRGAAPWA
jgi:xanthine dehydrogenase accessory factor